MVFLFVFHMLHKLGDKSWWGPVRRCTKKSSSSCARLPRRIVCRQVGQLTIASNWWVMFMIQTCPFLYSIKALTASMSIDTICCNFTSDKVAAVWMKTVIFAWSCSIFNRSHIIWQWVTYIGCNHDSV